LSPLLGCYFRSTDIASFSPTDRFVTGTDLIARWKRALGDERSAKAFIVGRIREERLQDCHPLTGVTRTSHQDSDAFPPLENALFFVAAVEAIEEADLTTPSRAVQGDAKAGGIAPKDFIARYHSKVMGGKKWLIQYFNGRTHERGEKPAARKFQIAKGRYNETDVLGDLKAKGRFSELGFSDHC
jgi:hypothetical protein